MALRVRDLLGDARVVIADELDPSAVDVVLLDVGRSDARRVRDVFAAAPGSIVPIVACGADGSYDWTRLVVERTVTVNTAAAGGNAALLSLAEDGA